MRIWSLWLHVTVVQDAWARAIQWVTKISAPNHPMLAATINSYFEGIKWTAALKGFGADYGIGVLSRILSSEWLAGDDVDILTELLRKEAAFSGISIAFLGRYQIMHIEGLQRAFAKNPLDGGIASKRATVVRQMGEDLLRGNTRYFGGIVNLDRVHWISFLIDGQQQCILIGDSLVDPNRSGLPVAKKYPGILSTLRWWIEQTSNLLGLTGTRFECQELEVNPQMDMDSCGIFAYNSLRHFIDPDHTPLLLAQSTVGARLCLANEILEYHCQNSPQVCLQPVMLTESQFLTDYLRCPMT
jgi:hypothetical protein